jgi:hypothetical protein
MSPNGHRELIWRWTEDDAKAQKNSGCRFRCGYHNDWLPIGGVSACAASVHL